MIDHNLELSVEGLQRQKGMSRGARWVLGSFTLFFAGIFVLTGSPSSGPLALTVLWICAGFCVLISVACLSSVARGPAIRIIGSVVFLLYVAYLILEIRKGLWRPYEGRGSEHWVNAIWGLIVFGLPGLYVAFRGRYPFWGQGAEGFLGEESKQEGNSNQKAHEE